MTLYVAVPTSKSMTQRALYIAGLATDPSVIERPLDCDDSRYLREALATLGASVDWAEARAKVVPARLPLAAPAAPLYCGNAGTAVRFTAPLSLICHGTLVIDGDPHMRKRPIGPLADGLAQLGVAVRYLDRPGCPPLALTRTSDAPGRVTVDASLSSQYASGLLLVAPMLPNGLEIELTGQSVSRPYLDMTVAMMRQRGARVEASGQSFRVEPGRYRGGEIAVEVDWSAAAFVLAAARIVGADIRPEGLASPERSLQGDAAIAPMLDGFDRRATNELDLTDVPDLIAPLCVAALFAAKPTRIRGAAHTRVKECDRVAVLARELAKIGAEIVALDDGLDVAPLVAPRREPIELDPEDDHRMAMAFGLVSLRVPGVSVKNRDCVSKSFPDFWSVLARIRDHQP
jgi:3-phosphoshikimate 1-carboxyvinyltransferase